ncbi:hypothetical protein OPV22_031099 [Ensete ventricosum]|uniref:TFIIS central domain-containing protein n=1 Tax=Ensete ventricosum TaxID=4639 RepID=A0AAV8PNR1_ENSVE|nr:hypothetical protein OPV22_031099 [Ensete ventricosum]
MESSEEGQASMSSNQVSQQFSSSNQSGQANLRPIFHSPSALNWGSQEWLSAERNSAQTRMQVPVPVILGSQQFYSMVNQSIQIQPSYRNLTPMPTSVGLGQISLSNRQVLGTQSSLSTQPTMSANLASQPSSSICKRPTLIRAPSKVQSFLPMNMGSQLSSTNKRPAQLEPPRKVQSESFESVRSKLRESLAASLAMESDRHHKQEIAEKCTPGDASSTMPKVITPMVELNSEAKSASSDKSALETVQNQAGNLSSKENPSNDTLLTRSDVDGLQPKDILLQKEVSNDNSLVKDELLQGHGLCWLSNQGVGTVDNSANHDHDRKRLKMTNEQETADKETTVRNAGQLAFRIEAELFRLFGGVNKKYKEKGRSLLFNLKDRNNPELRERVLSGAIAPEHLCTMTTEELASKELSQWRLAKAEELAQMVILPDTDVDLRRLVKKTHKGEFQVEVEQADSFPVVVELGTSALSQVTSKPSKEVSTQSKSNHKSDEPKASKRQSSARKIDSADQNLPSDIEILSEKADLMQELMVDELKDPELLPPVVSLDEFMQDLDSEPPFGNLSVGSLQEVSLEPEEASESDSVEHKQDAASGSLGSKSDSSRGGSPSKQLLSQEGKQPKLDSADATSKNPTIANLEKVDVECSKIDDNVKSGSVDIQLDTCLPEVTSMSDKIWEGSIQLNISAVATVIGFFRSGEKTSTQEWRSFLEIKGRVRLDAFEKFLKELPLSRSRAIMIAQFPWKEGSPESGRLNLLEVIDSYIADERVGYAEPAPGVELYLCPPHSRTTDILEKLLPKEHAEALPIAAAATTTHLIGVVVWRRPHSTISPRPDSHHKHGSSKKQHSSRKQQSQPPPEDYADNDDVPPGFGPGEYDDLPEFDFVHGSSQTSKPAAASVTRPPHVVAPGRPVDQIRELIHKYGHTETVKKPPFDVRRHWNDADEDDDDIPEWQPQYDRRVQPETLASSQPPPTQFHSYQQPTTFQSLHVNLPLSSLPNPQPMGLQPPQIVVMPTSLTMPPRWQQLPLSGGAADMPLPAANAWQTSPHYLPQANADGQLLYGFPSVGAAQNAMGWRPADVFGSRGM